MDCSREACGDRRDNWTQLNGKSDTIERNQKLQTAVIRFVIEDSEIDIGTITPACSRRSSL